MSGFYFRVYAKPDNQGKYTRLYAHVQALNIKTAICFA